MRRTIAIGLALALMMTLALGATGCDSGGGTGETAPLQFIQFYDPDCPYCQAMEPTVEKLRQEYEPQIQSFEIIDVSTKEGLAQAEEFGVFITPTFVLLDGDGTEIDRLQGAATEENMVKFIERGIDDVNGESSGTKEEIPTTGGTDQSTDGGGN